MTDEPNINDVLQRIKPVIKPNRNNTMKGKTGFVTKGSFATLPLASTGIIKKKTIFATIR